MTTSTLLEAGPAPNPGGGPGRPPGSATTPAPGAVFAPPEDPHNRITATAPSCSSSCPGPPSSPAAPSSPGTSTCPIPGGWICAARSP